MEEAFRMSAKRQHISQALQDFYHKPVALISVELLLSLGLVLFLGFFAIQPTLLTMSDLLKEIEEKGTLLEQLEKKATALNTAQQIYIATQPRLPLLEEAIPSQPELIRSLKIIEKLATENNVIIGNISSPAIPDEKPATETAKQTSVPVTISVVGDYPAIRSYVEALRGSRRLYTIQTVTFSLQENRGDKKLSASITVALPYYGESVISEK